MTTAVSTALADAGLIPPGAVVRLKPLAGGAVRRTWRADAASGETFVIRAPANVGLHESHPLPDEFAIHRAAHAAGIATPRPLMYGAAPIPLPGGPAPTPFYVMAWQPGTTDPRRITAQPSHVRATLAADLGRELARIHGRLTTGPTLAGPVAALCADAAGALQAHHDPMIAPVLAKALDWLAANDPGTPATVFAHRDYRVGNVILDNDRFAAVLDWEFARPSDPHEDLGWFTARCWRRHAPDSPTVAAGGLASLHTFLAAYGRPVDPVKLAFWQIAAHVRWAAIALQQIARAPRLVPPDPQLFALRPRLPALTQAIAAMIAVPLDRRATLGV